MKTARRIITLIIVVLVVGAGLFAGYRFTHMFDFLKHRPLIIEKTANVVAEVKKIGEFTSAVYYEEMALVDSYTDSATFMGLTASNLAGKTTRMLGLGFASKTAEKAAAVTNRTNEIVLIGKGRVRAGFDLGKLQEGDISVHGDTLVVVLPPAEVFDVIMNPSDFTTEYEKGMWSHELTKPIKERGKRQLLQDALDFGILDKAEESGTRRLKALFGSLGFKAVVLEIQ